MFPRWRASADGNAPPVAGADAADQTGFSERSDISRVNDPGLLGNRAQSYVTVKPDGARRRVVLDEVGAGRTVTQAIQNGGWLTGTGVPISEHWGGTMKRWRPTKTATCRPQFAAAGLSAASALYPNGESDDDDLGFYRRSKTHDGGHRYRGNSSNSGSTTAMTYRVWTYRLSRYPLKMSACSRPCDGCSRTMTSRRTRASILCDGPGEGL